MRHLMTFDHSEEPGVSEPWEYSVFELETLGKVQLWFKQPNTPRWEMGHSKEVPLGATSFEVAETMRAFICGTLSHESYNALLPR